MKLPKDATLNDMQASEVSKFARWVFDVMRRAQRDHGIVVRMRMGIMGKGEAPNYRIEDEKGLPLFAINGADHKPWQVSSFDGASTWSSATMSMADVEELIRRTSSSRR